MLIHTGLLHPHTKKAQSEDTDRSLGVQWVTTEQTYVGWMATPLPAGANRLVQSLKHPLSSAGNGLHAVEGTMSNCLTVTHEPQGKCNSKTSMPTIVATRSGWTHRTVKCAPAQQGKQLLSHYTLIHYSHTCLLWPPENLILSLWLWFIISGMFI